MPASGSVPTRSPSSTSAEDRRLHGLGLGEGVADGEVAKAEEVQQQQRGRDLRHRADQRPGREGQRQHAAGRRCRTGPGSRRAAPPRAPRKGSAHRWRPAPRPAPSAPSAAPSADSAGTRRRARERPRAPFHPSLPHWPWARPRRATFARKFPVKSCANDSTRLCDQVPHRSEPVAQRVPAHRQHQQRPAQRRAAGEARLRQGGEDVEPLRPCPAPPRPSACPRASPARRRGRNSRRRRRRSAPGAGRPASGSR